MMSLLVDDKDEEDGREEISIQESVRISVTSILENLDGSRRAYLRIAQLVYSHWWELMVPVRSKVFCCLARLSHFAASQTVRCVTVACFTNSLISVWGCVGRRGTCLVEVVVRAEDRVSQVRWCIGVGVRCSQPADKGGMNGLQTRESLCRTP